MSLYLISIYQPDEDPPPPEFLEPVMRQLHALNDEIRAAGSWVFTGGLHRPHASTVVRTNGSELLVTDGPYVEGKEFVGGFWIVDTPDLDAALRWGGRVARIVTPLPIEVRPFQHSSEG